MIISSINLKIKQVKIDNKLSHTVPLVIDNERFK